MNKQLFGELSIETFLSDYWQKKPLLIRQAFADHNPLIAADELAGLACEADVESRLIIQAEEDKDWQLQHGPFDDQVFADLPENNWTLLVQAVDHWLPTAAEFLQQFDFIPNWRIDDLMISYANQGGGVGPHYDNYDVFLIQAQGQREWQIGGQFNSQSARREAAPLLLLDQWQAEKTYLLKPGDMLYLPPQIGHNGIAIGDGCMTYSVGFRAPSVSELFTSFSNTLEDRLSPEDRYADMDLELSTNPGQIAPQALQKIQQLLQQQILDQKLVAEWFGSLVTEGKYASDQQDTRIQCTRADLLDHQSKAGLLARNEGSRFAYVEQDDQLLLFVDGQQFTCPRGLEKLVGDLCQLLTLDPGHYLLSTQANSAIESRSATEIKHHEQALDLFCQLIEQGSLYPLLKAE